MNEPPSPEVVVFAAALELPLDRRGAYLQQACAGADALRRQVEALLRVHDDAGNFFDKLAPVARATSAEGAMPGSIGTFRLPGIHAEKTGDRIGRYRLLQQIGEGGCGVVYMAEQEDPVRRKVALKVIKLGLDTKSVIARFEAERQALALMDHPNIAKVLDAGATEIGRPYFVMELVRGLKITDYCDENNLSTTARLTLFIQVCQAIQHAHQKGIIHRDIKPTNILVADHDGVPVPKIIDFGIAKATTDQRLTDKTLFTAIEQFIGTPAYMSPEQAKLSGLDIDTRSDIYSLGVLLYELLTAKTPFETKRLLEMGLDEIRRIIREDEPLRPSTRLQTLDAAEQTTVARHRQSEPPKLFGILRGDLDWIVMKCLEKDRARRYETANGLAADLQRFLSNEPVNARPPSGLYRLQKSIRRNKVVFAAAGVIAAVLVVGVVMSTLEAIRATRAEREQSRLRLVAETKEKKSEQVAEFLKDMLQGVGPSVALGRDTTILREILDNTAERVGKDLTIQPDVRAELQNAIGKAYSMVGEDGKADTMLRQGLATRRKLFGDDDPLVAESLHDLAASLRDRGFNTEAETLHRQALAIRRKHFGSQSLMVADSLRSLAHVLQISNPAEAGALLREALAVDRKVWGEGSVELAEPLRLLALVIEDQKPLEAESLVRQALAIDQQRPGSGHPEVAFSERVLAEVLYSENKLDEAEAMARAALALRRKVCANQPGALDDAMNLLASILYKAGKLPESEAVALEAAGIEKQIEPNHPGLSWSLTSLSLVHARTGRWKEAVGELTQLTELEPANAWSQCSLAAMLVETGDLPDYRARRQKIAATFGGSSDPKILFSGANACLLSPSAGRDLETACQFADRLVTWGNQRFYGFAKGLAEYRRGHLANSIEWMQKVIQPDPTFADPNPDMSAYAVIAMAENQRQHPEPARAALASSLEISRTKTPQPGNADLGDDWPDWLIAHILLREAQDQIQTR